MFGLPDERPALELAWRQLVQNQAHDSIGGCSVDGVHERMHGRYDDAEGLGQATATRMLERMAGRNVVRDTPWTEAQDVVVFNASAETRTDLVRVPLEGFPPWRLSVTRFDFHPLAMPTFRGMTIDGAPVRIVPSDDPQRVQFLPGVGGLDAEFVATDVPAFGCRRYRMEPAAAVADEVDTVPSIAADDVSGRGRIRRHARDRNRRRRNSMACSTSKTVSISATPTTPTPTRRVPSRDP